MGRNEIWSPGTGILIQQSALTPWLILNEWDIGITYTSPNIVLFKPTSSASKGTRHWPMLIHASQNFGSIETTMMLQETLYKVKVYPRLVHVIKSFNSRIQGEPLLTLLGAKKRAKACVNMAHTYHKWKKVNLVASESKSLFKPQAWTLLDNGSPTLHSWTSTSGQQPPSTKMGK
jgi:hypothetical protein